MQSYLRDLLRSPPESGNGRVPEKPEEVHRAPRETRAYLFRQWLNFRWCCRVDENCHEGRTTADLPLHQPDKMAVQPKPCPVVGRSVRKIDRPCQDSPKQDDRKWNVTLGRATGSAFGRRDQP